MSLFKNHFTTLLEAEANVEEPVPSPEEALKAELDPGTNPDDLGASAPIINMDKDIEASKTAAFESQVAELDGWIAKINEFVSFLNDPNSNSVQMKLSDAGCDTMFEKIKSSEHKRIARIAVELSGLVQSLNGFKIAGND
jgi:hypothetical protein